MHLRYGVLPLAFIGMFTSQGCGAKPQADSSLNPPAAAGLTANESAPQSKSIPADQSVAASPSPAKPTPEQIAKWETPKYDPLELFTCSDGFDDPAVQCMAVSPDRKQFVLAGAKLTLWNTDGSKPSVDLLAKYKAKDVERPLSSVAISADGKLLAAGDQKGTVRIWSTSDGHEAAVIQAHDGHVRQVAFSPDSHLLATTSYSGEVILWQLPDGQKLNSLKMSEQEISRLEFLSNSLLAVAGSETSIWNVDSGKKETVLSTKSASAPALGVSQDRRLIAFGESDSAILLWSVGDSKSVGAPLHAPAALLWPRSPGAMVRRRRGQSPCPVQPTP
jgi:WD40 repeat protein